ncbi:unnamed protein product [Candida verbasci]|uniref:CDP-diacylglycerol--glycerol-3-phosphate 3-phosphatidyltransferase n=1 Tax=Candida verbasci TaxID=1227364 RepID=A0A9W4TZN4_9ASCO|nr:unnamed protein product [Candida verbasci]
MIIKRTHYSLRFKHFIPLISYPSINMINSIYNYFFNYNKPLQNHHSNFSTASQINDYLPSDISSNFNPKLYSLIQQLDSIAPRFLINSSDIEILMSPKDFYSTLKDKIKSSKDRIFLSSLYIGKKQIELIECLDDALTTNPNLKIYILTDALRGTRESPNQPSSASILTTLQKKHDSRIDIRMYHTPNLQGITKNILPKRLNEGWGLQHMKLYGFDNEIILSGANLSQDYFTNRQDRYYIFKDEKLTNYYFKIHKVISSISYKIKYSDTLKQGFKMVWPTTNPTCEPHLNLQRYISDVSYLIKPILQQNKLSSFEQYNYDNSNFDTLVYPISQFTPLFPKLQDYSTELPSILRILSFLSDSKIKWWFTAGYFNMLPTIQSKLLHASSTGKVITASPKANSFYKSSGISYYLPMAYLLFAKKFLEEIKKMGKETMITVYEWQNGIVNTINGWSYHAKGIWVSIPNESVPSLTIIGSSNYTKRAYNYDLESNAIVITKNEELKQKMKFEIDNLMKYANELTLDDFRPKKQNQVENDKELDTVVIKETLNDEHQPKYEIDEDRKISYGVHLAVKLLGGKL